LQKQWALATTAIRTSQNGDRHDVLGGQEKTAEHVLSAKRLLHGWWSVDSREDLLRVLEGFEKDDAGDEGDHETHEVHNSASGRGG